MNKSGGSEMVKTGSQVLDSICISEAEKQAVLTLIREEVHTYITVIQHDKCLQCVCFYSSRFFLDSFNAKFVSKQMSLCQIITKEVEVSDWKKKFEAGRQEVTEMRLENMSLGDGAEFTITDYSRRL